MHIYLDTEKNEIFLGDHVIVWDNFYKALFRCEVTGFTPQKVKIKLLKKSDTYITLLKNPSDLLITKD